jgi:hypothetical protein
LDQAQILIGARHSIRRSFSTDDSSQAATRQRLQDSLETVPQQLNSGRATWHFYATTWHTSNMVRAFKTRHFQRWMRKTELTDSALLVAVSEMAAGLIDADLGAGVVKKRIGLAGRGKRGGARTLVATNKDNRWFFVFGFEKSERDNISDDELESLQDLASHLLALTAPQLDAAVTDGALQEISQ